MTEAPPRTPIELDPAELKRALDAAGRVLVDVREEAEHREERIAGAVPMPLSRFDAQALREAHPGKRLVFHCKAGKRSAKACSLYADEPTEHLAGGIDAWKAAGLPTVKPDYAPRLPIMRQVFLAAGALVAVGTLLAAAASPWFLVVPGFVGCGLMFSGATGWCGMAVLLSRMPWNRSAAI